MSLATVLSVAPGSPAAESGVVPGDELVSIGGRPLRDVIEFRVLSDEADVELELRRGGLELNVEIAKAHGEPLGADEVVLAKQALGLTDEQYAALLAA